VAGEVWIQPPPPEVLFPQSGPTYGVFFSVNSAQKVYRSYDDGATWVDKSPGAYGWRAFGANPDGSVIYVDQSAQGPWVSTNWGDAWASKTGGFNVDEYKCNSNGVIVLAAVGYGQPRLSQDGGNTWTTVTDVPNAYWRDCWVSLNGSILALCGDSQAFWISWDCGTNWTSKSLSVASNRRGLCLSQDGKYVFLATCNGTDGCYLSSDSGDSWTKITAIPNGYYYKARSSTNFSRIFVPFYANSPNSVLYFSLDAGTNWSSLANSEGGQFVTIDCDSDGEYVVQDSGDGTKYLYGTKYPFTSWFVLEAVTRGWPDNRSGVLVRRLK